MSIIISNYKDKLDKCWYDSSNVLYSQCVDNDNDFKDLQITFKDGRTYLYQGVNVNDYILFKMDISQGKALNKYIIKKYKGVRLSDMDLSILNEEKEKLLEERKSNEKELESDVNPLYHVITYDEEQKIELYLNNKVVYSSDISSINLIEVLKILGIRCSSENK